MGANRREFLGLAAAAATIGLAMAAEGQDRAADREDAAPSDGARRRCPIGVSTDSFCEFRGELLGIEACIDKGAAEWMSLPEPGLQTASRQPYGGRGLSDRERFRRRRSSSC